MSARSVIPAEAGIHRLCGFMNRGRSPVWIPACAGMTGEGCGLPSVIPGLTRDPGLRVVVLLGSGSRLSSG